MRKLSYKALTLMEGQKVKVHDLEYDIYDQICTVRHRKEWDGTKRILTGIHLDNEEYIFTYTQTGKPSNGDFEVYTLDDEQDKTVENLENNSKEKINSKEKETNSKEKETNSKEEKLEDKKVVD